MSWEIEREETDNGLEVIVYADEDAESPRQWDNLGHMLTWGSRYDSPDENPYADFQDFAADMLYEQFSAAELLAFIEDGKIPSLRIGQDEEGNARVEQRYPKGWGDAYCDWEADDFEDCQRNGLVGIIAEETGIALLESKMDILPVYRFEHSCVSYSTVDFKDPWDSGLVGIIYATPKDAKRFYGDDEPKPGSVKVRAQLVREVETYSQWANGDVYGVSVERGGEVVDSLWGVYEDALDEVKADLLANAA